MSADEAPADPPTATVTRRELAVARALDQARSRAENRVQLFLDAALRAHEHATRASSPSRRWSNGPGSRCGPSTSTSRASTSSCSRCSRSRSARPPRTSRRSIAEGDEPLDRLHRFAVEYYRMCRLTPKGQPPPGRAADGGVRAAAADVASRRKRRRRSRRSSSLLEDLLDDAAAAGEIRPGLDHRRIAGVVLQATMFNAFAAAISGSSSELDGDAESETLWDLLLRGIGTAD